MTLAVREGASAPSLAPLACTWCGQVFADDDRDLSDEELRAFAEHECEEYRAWRTRVRRNQEPGWWAGSYSSLSSFDLCEAQYKFAQESPDRFSGAAAELGSVVHAYYHAKHTGADFDLGELPVDEGDDYEWMKRVLDEHTPPEGARFEQELFIRWPVRAGLTAEIRCFIDVLWFDWTAGVAYLIDWKTGRRIDKKSWRTQRKMYALAVLRNVPGIWKVVASTIAIRPDKTYADEITASDAEIYAQHLAAKVAYITEPGREFRPQPSPEACHLCDFAFKCDAAPRVLSELTFDLKVKKLGRKKTTKLDGGQVLDVEDYVEVMPWSISIPADVASDTEKLQRLARAKFHIDKLSEAINKILKQAPNGGRVELPELGGAYAPWVKKSKKVKDVNAFLTLLAEKGLDPEETGVTVNHNRVKWLLESDPDMAALTEEVEDRYSAYEFRRFKTEKEDGDDEASA